MMSLPSDPAPVSTSALAQHRYNEVCLDSMMSYAICAVDADYPTLYTSVWWKSYEGI